MIAALERRLNRDDDSAAMRRLAGMFAALMVIGVATGAGALAVVLLPSGWAGVTLGAVLAWPLVAARSMHDHVRAVARPLAQGDIAQAREAVSMIVGRDPSHLDQAGVARAALESLAKNTSDGIIAPLF